MANQIYRLEAGAVVSRNATEEELRLARQAALEKLQEDAAGYAVRSCWNCNPAHEHFLQEVDDGFLFACIMGCGRWFYEGTDITESDD